MKTMAPSNTQKRWRDSSLPPLLRLGSEDLFYFEQIKALRAKLETKIEALRIKVLAVTSSIAGEGKTLSCANLGANLASAGTRKVLLIDVDLRKSDLARGMDVKPLPGLTEYLAGTVDTKDIVRESVTPGLWIIPAGTRSSDPTDLLAGEKFREFLRQAREKCDIVLLDTPPILPVADTLTIKDQIDGFLFLFRAGFTPHQMLGQALDDVGEQKVLGVVLNGVETKSQNYYRKYYGKYYNNP
jgi:capsular exopolysaccharide synthesis family protein